MNKAMIETDRHCAYCGHSIPDDVDAPERFGEHFCSEGHADEFVAGVRAARIEAAASGGGNRSDHVGAHARPPGPRSWRDSLKQGACWGAPLLLLLAVPLFWNGAWGAAGGTLLTAIAFLACPVGMYFMMRSMKNMPQQGGGEAPRGRGDEEHRHA